MFLLISLHHLSASYLFKASLIQQLLMPIGAVLLLVHCNIKYISYSTLYSFFIHIYGEGIHSYFNLTSELVTSDLSGHGLLLGLISLPL